MRVLHVIPSIARSEGGPSEVIRRLLPELQGRGLHVRVVTTDKFARDEDHDLLALSNVRVVPNRVRSWTFSPRIIPTLWSEIAACDLVHVHSIHTFPTTVALAVARLRGRPVILQPHGALNSYHLAHKRRLKLLYLRIVDRFGLSSIRSVLYSSTAEGSQGRFAIPGIAGDLLPLGIDDRLLEIARADVDPPQVLFLARLAKKKRVDLFIRSLASKSLHESSFSAVIAGPIDSDLDYDPRDLLSDLGLTERVTLVGQVEADARAELLSTSAIYVLPSDDESFGISVAEAMGSGCAVVTSPHVGVSVDAMDSGASLVVPQDPAVIGEAIATLLAQPRARRALGQDAREYARANLTWPAIADVLVGYYHEAVKPKRMPTGVAA